ncbi:MAG: cyclic nucleotide-binding domain-containing protein [Solidesulfovibrio sp. DCME]|uniref:cyclic nucleotide-binding domain-containing protein n=1 Tax=Solidesulfovibrio sp. DCME TaxID=3447380 RepID=UPI003D0FB847
MSLSTDRPLGLKGCGFNDCLDILRELPIFSGVPLDVIKVLAYLSGRESFVAGETLCEQGEPLDRCFYVLSGELEMSRQVGDCPVVLPRRGQGSFFGGLGLLAPAKALFAVKAVADAECLVLTKEKFQKTAERFPEIWPKVLGNVVDHVFRWEETFLAAHAEECATSGEMGLSLF